MGGGARRMGQTAGLGREGEREQLREDGRGREAARGRWRRDKYKGRKEECCMGWEEEEMTKRIRLQE